MQFYLRLYLDTNGNVTLGKLGDWEQESVYEYEAYMTAYIKKLEAEIKAQRKQERNNKIRRRR